MPAEIITQRGISVLPASVDQVDASITLVGSDTSKAFIRNISTTPYHMGPDAGTISPQTNDVMSASISFLNTTTIRIQAKVGLTALSRRVVWEVWEYVGATGGPNEFIVRSNDGREQVTGFGGAILTSAASPTAWTAVDNNDVIIFHRGLEWSGFEGNTIDPEDGMIILQADSVFGSDFFRFTRGVSTANEEPFVHYSAVEFTGSNWTVQRVNNTSPPTTATPVTETISSVGDWLNAFIYAQRSSTQSVDRRIGMVAYREINSPSPTEFFVRYTNNGSGGTAFDQYMCMIVSNPLMRVVHNNSFVTDGGSTFPANVGGTGLQEEDVAITLLAAATIGSTLNSAAVMGGAIVASGPGTNFPAPSWVQQMQSDGSGGDEVRWARSLGTKDVDWGHFVLNLRFPETGSWLLGTREITVTLVASAESIPGTAVAKVGFRVTVTDPDLEAAVLDASISAALASLDCPVTVAEATDMVTEALADLPVDITVATITVTLPNTLTQGTAPEDTMATLDICPVSVDICVTRADTEPFSFSLVDDSAVAIDITGYSFVMTANEEEDPTDETNQLFQLAGGLSGTPTDGVVTFEPIDTPTVTFENAGNFFYDVQQTDDSGFIRTIIKGKLEIRQDITKSIA